MIIKILVGFGILIIVLFVLLIVAVLVLVHLLPDDFDSQIPMH